MSYLQTSLKRRRGHPRSLQLEASSPCRRTLWILTSVDSCFPWFVVAVRLLWIVLFRAQACVGFYEKSAMSHAARHFTSHHQCFPRKKVLPNTAWHWWRLRSYQNEDEHNIELYRESGSGFIIFPMIGYGLKLTVGLIPSINITVIYYFKTYNQCCGFRCYHL